MKYMLITSTFDLDHLEHLSSSKELKNNTIDLIENAVEEGLCVHIHVVITKNNAFAKFTHDEVEVA